jgi:transposase
MFLYYVEQNLVLTLRQGDVVIMDNLASRKVAGVQEAIERRARDSFIRT